jgi:Ran GTPase-activating protein (RanGAP) involved in mRNA processing and transport
LRTLYISNNPAGVHFAPAGAALGALIAANAPALRRLSINECLLGNAGMQPLINALRSNTHLRALTCNGNGMSAAFARNVLLPAVRANTSLTTLEAGDSAAAQEAAALVAARAAPRG